MGFGDENDTNSWFSDLLLLQRETPPSSTGYCPPLWHLHCSIRVLERSLASRMKNKEKIAFRSFRFLSLQSAGSSRSTVGSLEYSGVRRGPLVHQDQLASLFFVIDLIWPI